MPDVIADFFDKYDNRFHSFLYRKLGSKEDADDVAQDVYLILIRHRDLENLKPSFALLCKIASDLIKDRFRKQRAHFASAHTYLDDEKIASAAASPEDITRSKECLEMLTNVFNSMKKQSREAFLLHRFKGLTYEKIAHQMDISRSMVQRHISHVLLELDKAYEEHYGNK